MRHLERIDDSQSQPLPWWNSIKFLSEGGEFSKIDLLAWQSSYYELQGHGSSVLNCGIPNKHSRVHFQSDVTARGGLELHMGGAQSAEDTSERDWRQQVPASGGLQVEWLRDYASEITATPNPASICQWESFRECRHFFQAPSEGQRSLSLPRLSGICRSQNSPSPPLLGHPWF